MIHKLKCIQPYFNEVANGVKDFEVRKDDRNYQVGDRLDLYEGPEDIADNGIFRNHVHKYIKYKLPGGSFGIKDGYCVLGLSDDPIPANTFFD